MKISEILEGYEDDYDVVRDRMREYFDDNYVELAGVVSLHPEDIQYVIKDVADKADFSNEVGMLDKMQKTDDDIYIRNNEELINRLDKLEGTLSKEDNPTLLVRAIKEFMALLSSNMTTINQWEESREAKEVEHEEFARHRNPN
jgi:predicted transcriptional regulator